MIAPNKHTEIQTSIPYMAGLILQQISNGKSINYDDLKAYVEYVVGKNVGDAFDYALCFLFLLNRICYNSTSDTFTLISK